MMFNLHKFTIKNTFIHIYDDKYDEKILKAKSFGDLPNIKKCKVCDTNILYNKKLQNYYLLYHQNNINKLNDKDSIQNDNQKSKNTNEIKSQKSKNKIKNNKKNNKIIKNNKLDDDDNFEDIIQEQIKYNEEFIQNYTLNDIIELELSNSSSLESKEIFLKNIIKKITLRLECSLLPNILTWHHDIYLLLEEKLKIKKLVNKKIVYIVDNDKLSKHVNELRCNTNIQLKIYIYEINVIIYNWVEKYYDIIKSGEIININDQIYTILNNKKGILELYDTITDTSIHIRINLNEQILR